MLNHHNATVCSCYQYMMLLIPLVNLHILTPIYTTIRALEPKKKDAWSETYNSQVYWSTYKLKEG